MNEEPFGLVALETMSKGLPLITTNSGALPEITGDGALIVDKNGDFVTDLAKAMLTLALSDALREKLGKKAYARARAVKAFDIQNYYEIQKSVDIYQAIAKSVAGSFGGSSTSSASGSTSNNFNITLK